MPSIARSSWAASVLLGEITSAGRPSPELDPQGLRLGRGREHLDHVTAHPEGPAPEVVVVSLVLHRDQGTDQGVAVHALARPQGHVHAVVGLGLADAVDARDRGDHHHVPALEERRGGGVPHAVDLVVHQRVLLDVGVGLRDVGLGLVVVVVGDEVLDRVARKERLELAVELGRERLVGRDHQRGAAETRHHVGEGEGLAAAGHAQQDGVGAALADHGHQTVDRLRLVPGGGELGGEREQHRVVRGTAQDVDGTATRYFRHESRNEVACGCRSRCTEKRNCGCTGSRISRSRASSRVRLPLSRLQRRRASAAPRGRPSASPRGASSTGRCSRPVARCSSC